MIGVGVMECRVYDVTESKVSRCARKELLECNVMFYGYRGEIVGESRLWICIDKPAYCTR